MNNTKYRDLKQFWFEWFAKTINDDDVKIGYSEQFENGIKFELYVTGKHVGEIHDIYLHEPYKNRLQIGVVAINNDTCELEAKWESRKETFMIANPGFDREFAKGLNSIVKHGVSSFKNLFKDTDKLRELTMYKRMMKK